MPQHPYHRTELLLGRAAWARLARARVAVIGLGGVGGYALEALARSGVGHLTLVDMDRVCLTNLNRQLVATHATVGRDKARLAADRVRAISPSAELVVHAEMYCAEQDEALLGPGYDVVLDCIDRMNHKLDLLASCRRRGQPVITSVGAARRVDPTRVRVGDLFDVVNDPFARVLRKKLRRRGIDRDVPCVWSDEPPVPRDEEVAADVRCICPGLSPEQVARCESRPRVEGSTSWIPGIFGLTMAGEVIRQLAGLSSGVR